MNLLAFDTSTDTLSIAVQRGGDAVLLHQGPGGAQASATLIPAVRSLMAQAGITFDTLDAVVFGRGPGSFTGLRTACAVAQGLAFGARGGQGVPVLPVDTLLAVAEEARVQHGCTQVVAVLDARMNEVYHAQCEWIPAEARWHTDADFGLGAPETVQPPRAGPWPATPARPTASGWPRPQRMSWPCPRQLRCCVWPRRCWLRVAGWLPVMRCRATSAIKWRKPRPSAPPSALPLHHERPAQQPQPRCA